MGSVCGWAGRGEEFCTGHGRARCQAVCTAGVGVSCLYGRSRVGDVGCRTLVMKILWHGSPHLVQFFTAWKSDSPVLVDVFNFHVTELAW